MRSSQARLLCHYRYDPLDRLTSHAQSDALERQRFYCKSRLATEIEGALSYSVVQQGDLLLAEQHRTGNALDTALLATDQQRSVLHVFKSNVSQQPITYSPYGHRRNESGLTSLLGFNGERPEPVTGRYLLGNGYRAFSPVLMRFNSPDSWSPFGRGGLNAYAYCQGNPVLRTDPTGHVLIMQSRALNVLPPKAQGQFVGYYVGARAPLPGLKNGGTLSGAAMHASGERLGPGLYATSDYDVAKAFLNRADPKSRAQMFGVHHTGDFEVSQYGHGLHPDAGLQTVAQSGSTYRIPNTQYDNLILTELSPPPAAGGAGVGVIPPVSQAGEQIARPSPRVPSAAPQPSGRSAGINHASALAFASMGVPSAGGFIRLRKQASAVRHYPQ
ncbi:RHS repeat-associated core domain-containing protein [Pseudomonas sp. PB120]|uniref:RHS repeat-associated core domain-containing protein n=1 Tax=Pseudomonas sp. PB120 TaxID=2494700 RepID=UPI0012FD9FEC|nr:RHS repeat-associated core domain-containing protein [Pseudomonas sp. PB120]MVV50454.1 RHS repeat-associated core domain-containing protein [Pseudomonas sp. PB120]